MLRGICRTDEDAQAAHAAIHTYGVGFAALEAARSANAPVRPPGPVAEQLAAYTSAEQSACGLVYLLDGIELPDVTLERIARLRLAAPPRAAPVAVERGTMPGSQPVATRFGLIFYLS